MAAVDVMMAPLFSDFAKRSRSPASTTMSCSTYCLSEASSRPSSASSRSFPSSTGSSSRNSSASSFSRPSSASSRSSLPMLEHRHARPELSMSHSSSSLASLGTDTLPELCPPSVTEACHKDAGKIVRRRCALKKTTLPGLAGNAILSRRRTMPEASEKSSTVTPRRSQSVPSLSKQANARKVLPNEGRQAKAIKALAALLSCSEPSFEAVIRAMSSPVLKNDSDKAFLPEHIRHAIIFEREASGLQSNLLEEWIAGAPKAIAGPFAVQVLNLLAQRANLCPTDVFGQILWHFQKSEALQDRLEKTSKDLAWLDALADDRTNARPTELVERIFRKHMNAEGQLDQRTFFKIMDRSLEGYIDKESGVTKYLGSRSSCRRSDLDQLFFSQAHRQGQRGLSLHGFKLALMTLAKDMQVHPRSLFITVGGQGS